MPKAARTALRQDYVVGWHVRPLGIRTSCLAKGSLKVLVGFADVMEASGMYRCISVGIGKAWRCDQGEVAAGLTFGVSEVLLKAQPGAVRRSWVVLRRPVI